MVVLVRFLCCAFVCVAIFIRCAPLDTYVEAMALTQHKRSYADLEMARRRHINGVTFVNAVTVHVTPKALLTYVTPCIERSAIHV
jgi:hypothetical protein